MTIVDYLLNNVKKYCDEEAVVYVGANDERYSMSWKDVNTYANIIASLLLKKGIEKGDKVAILLSNSLSWIPIYFGILKTGAVVVPLNYRNSIDTLTYCLKRSDCRGLFLEENNEKNCILKKVLQENGIFSFEVCKGKHFLKSYVFDLNAEEINHDLVKEDNAAIYFSSGTTGREKAILLTHGALLSAAEMELSHHHQQHEERFLCLSPLYHTGSKIHWFGSFLVGGTLVILESISPVKIMNVIEAENIGIAFLLVSHIQDILDAIEIGNLNVDKMNLSSFRLMHSGAQPVPASLIQRWICVFPNLQYDTNYGLTEATGPGCIHLGVENISKVGSIGKPDQLWSARIVDKNNMTVEDGRIGELIVKGPGIMKEYYKDSQATREVIREGWLYTGDMAYKDNGFIYLVDRKKDVIIYNGENIYPVQIEEHIRLLECVKDVAVVGGSHKRMGEVVNAVIELKEGFKCSKQEIYAHCKLLPEYQRPLRIYFDEVVRNATGKIDKKFLKERITNKQNYNDK